jgi:hypothetical protein
MDGSMSMSVAASASIPLSARPNGSAIYDSATKLIYLGTYNSTAGASPTSGGIVVIDTTTNMVKTVIPTDLIVGGLAINPNSNKIYAAASTFSGPPKPAVYVIDPTTQTIKSTLSPGAMSQISAAVAVDPDANKVYVLNNDFVAKGGSIVVLDGASDTMTKTIAVANTTFQSSSAAIQPATHKLFAVGQKYNDSANVIANVIDTTADSIKSSMPYAGNFVGVAASTAGSAAIALNGATPRVELLDPCPTTLPQGAILRSITMFRNGVVDTSASIIYCLNGYEWFRNIDNQCGTVYEFKTDQPSPHCSTDDPNSCPGATVTVSASVSGGENTCGYYVSGCDNVPSTRLFKVPCG